MVNKVFPIKNSPQPMCKSCFKNIARERVSGNNGRYLYYTYSQLYMPSRKLTFNQAKRFFRKLGLGEKFRPWRLIDYRRRNVKVVEFEGTPVVLKATTKVGEFGRVQFSTIGRYYKAHRKEFKPKNYELGNYRKYFATEDHIALEFIDGVDLEAIGDHIAGKKVKRVREFLGRLQKEQPEFFDGRQKLTAAAVASINKGYSELKRNIGKISHRLKFSRVPDNSLNNFVFAGFNKKGKPIFHLIDQPYPSVLGKKGDKGKNPIL